MSRYEQLRRVESEVGVLVRRVRRVMGDRARLVHPDLHPISFMMLGQVVEAGPLRAADLACTFSMDKAGVSRQVQQLVELGLVERHPDPDDRRATLLAGTPEALRRIERMQRQRSERFDQRLGDWSDEELAEFAERLSRYNETLGAVESSPGSN